MSTEVMVGRQPIYDRELELVAYELLFRDTLTEDSASFTDADEATSRVIFNTFLEFGIDYITEGLPAFINLTRGFLTGQYPLPLDKDLIVLEVLESVTVDAALVSHLQRLSAEGYTIALDDFIYRPEYAALVEVADIVKIDLRSMTPEMVAEHACMLRRPGKRLLAEKVETAEEFERCMRLEFDYYQGFFLAQPSTISGDKNPQNRRDILQLLTAVNDPEVSATELVLRMSNEPSVRSALVRLLNTDKLDPAPTFVQAAKLLGDKKLRNWLSLIALSRFDGKPRQLIATSIIRAKMSEILADTAGLEDVEDYFTAGLLTGLATLFQADIAHILGSLRAPTTVTAALLRREGSMGAALDCVLNYERGAWNRVAFGELDKKIIKKAYLQSIAWSRGITERLLDRRERVRIETSTG